MMDQIKPEFMKKLTKFIVISIWVSSLLITHNSYLYKLTIQLATQAVDKKYMFLLCNGLVVFVAKYSGLIASSNPVEESWTSKSDKTFDYRDFDSYDAILELQYQSVHERGTESFLADEVSTKDEETEEDKEEEDDEEEEEEDDEEEEEEEEESAEPLTNNGELEEERDIRGGFNEEEDNVGVVTEEDINKKFDEFIRKMKEELRIEASRHLILV